MAVWRKYFWCLGESPIDEYYKTIFPFENDLVKRNIVKTLPEPAVYEAVMSLQTFFARLKELYMFYAEHNRVFTTEFEMCEMDLIADEENVRRQTENAPKLIESIVLGDLLEVSCKGEELYYFVYEDAETSEKMVSRCTNVTGEHKGIVLPVQAWWYIRKHGHKQYLATAPPYVQGFEIPNEIMPFNQDMLQRSPAYFTSGHDVRQRGYAINTAELRLCGPYFSNALVRALDEKIKL